MNGYFVHPTSIIDDDVEIGDGTKIWHFSHIQNGVKIGKKCTLGQNVNVANDVKVGDGCKIQNNVSIYSGVELENYVFCGPSMVFTNDLTPRARLPKGKENYKKTIVRHDATLGANCTIVCGRKIGEFAMVAAGAVADEMAPNISPSEIEIGISFVTASEIPVMTIDTTIKGITDSKKRIPTNCFPYF